MNHYNRTGCTTSVRKQTVTLRIVLALKKSLFSS
jgi:hypothetical protein